MKQRVRRLRLNYPFLAGLLRTGRTFRVARGLPSDAEILRAYVTAEEGLVAVVRSSQFSEIGEDARIPFLENPVIEVTEELGGAPTRG